MGKKQSRQTMEEDRGEENHLVKLVQLLDSIYIYTYLYILWILFERRPLDEVCESL